MALINHVEWTKTCDLGEFPLSASYGACVCTEYILLVSMKTVKEVINDKAHGTYKIVRHKTVKHKQ